MADTAPDPPVFTDEEVLDHAKGNAPTFGLALLRYGREHGEAAELVARWLGELFAPGWGRMRGRGAYEMTRMAALNLVSSGATLRDLSGNEHHAEATVAGWPGEEDLAFFGVSQDEADAIFSVFAPIAAQVGLRYRWQRQGDAITMSFEQETG